MATSTITPAGSSAPASGAGSGSGTSSPSTSSPSTPASSPQTTPVTTPTTSQPAAPPDFKTGDNSRDYLKKIMGDAFKTPEMKEALGEGAEVKPVPATEKPAGEAVAQPVVEQTPEQKAAAEKAVADAEAAKTAPTEVNPLDKIGPLPAEKLAAALTANPALEAELTKAGIDKETLFQTARDAALTSQYQEVLPTPEAAKFAVESANHFYDIEDRFPTINSVQDLDKFVMDTMLPLSVIRGADGQPLMNPDGKTFQTDGSVERFMRYASDLDHGMITHIAKQIGGDQGQQLLDAVEFIDKFRQNGYKFGAAGADGEKRPLDPAIEAELSQARTEREQNAQRSRDHEVQQTQAFETKFTDTTIDRVEPLVVATLNATSLDDYGKTNAAKDIWAEVTSRLKNDRTFQQQLSGMKALGRGEENLKQIVAFNTNTIKSILPGIMNKVLAAAGARQIDAHNQKLDKINEQLADDRMNRAGGASSTATQTQPLSPEAMFDKAMSDVAADAKAKGEAPSDSTLRQRAIVKFAHMQAAAGATA